MEAPLRVHRGRVGGGGHHGALLGFFGILFAGSKRAWLGGRLLTERMRQFHFQSMIAWAPDILSAQNGEMGRIRPKASCPVRALSAGYSCGGWNKYDAIIDQPRQGPGLCRDRKIWMSTTLRMSTSWPAPIKISESTVKYASPNTNLDRVVSSSLHFPMPGGPLSGAALICVLGLIALHIAVVVGIYAHAG